MYFLLYDSNAFSHYTVDFYINGSIHQSKASKCLIKLEKNTLQKAARKLLSKERSKKCTGHIFDK